jgi:hypothetical protein
MQSYLFIGSDYDGLSYPAADDAESVEFPIGVTDVDFYTRSTLTVDVVSITIFRDESLTPEQVLERLVEYYRAWAVNRPGGRQ